MRINFKGRDENMEIYKCGSVKENDLRLLHRRMAHVNYKTLRYMVRNGIVRGSDFNTERVEDCETCIQAKRPRETIGCVQPNRADQRS